MTTAPPAAPPVTPTSQVGRSLRLAWLAAAASIETMPARVAYAAATDVGELAAELVEAAAGLRARMAARVARETPGSAADGGLTVRELAVELGVAPSKAGEFRARDREETRRRPDPQEGSGRPSGGPGD